MQTQFWLEIQAGRHHFEGLGVAAKGNIKMGVEWI
jgi:hypothetical protein